MGVPSQLSPQPCLDENIPLKRRQTSGIMANDVFNTAFYEPDQEAECTYTEHNDLSTELTFKDDNDVVPVMNRASSLLEDLSISIDEKNELKKLDEMIARHPYLLGILTPIFVQVGILLLLILMFSTFGVSSLFDIIIVKLCWLASHFL